MRTNVIGSRLCVQCTIFPCKIDIMLEIIRHAFLKGAYLSPLQQLMDCFILLNDFKEQIIHKDTTWDPETFN